MHSGKMIADGARVVAHKGSESRLVDRGREAVFLDVWKEENKFLKPDGTYHYPEPKDANLKVHCREWHGEMKYVVYIQKGKYGHLDLEESEFASVTEENELDDGAEELREGQRKRKVNHLSQSISKT